VAEAEEVTNLVRHEGGAAAIAQACPAAFVDPYCADASRGGLTMGGAVADEPALDVHPEVEIETSHRIEVEGTVDPVEEIGAKGARQLSA